MVAGNLRSTPNLRRLRTVYFIMHSLFLAIGVGIVMFMALAYHFQAEDMKEVGHRETGPAHVVLASSGGLLSVASIIGIFALLKDKKPYLWVVYCMAMAVLTFSIFITAVSVVSHHIIHIDDHLNKTIAQYQDYDRGNLGWNSTRMKRLIDMVDDLQEFNDCCGVHSYTDWQDVEFGRTSLKVPKSCCKLKDSKTGEKITRKMISDRRQAGTLSNETEEAYQFCGDLCLPSHPKLNVTINTRGCLDVVTYRIHDTLEGTGIASLAVSILVGLVFGFSCFLVVTKRV